MNIWVQMQGAMISTNAPPATNAGTTELQMRQDKAKEANHAP
jgi:hypothetical protein